MHVCEMVHALPPESEKELRIWEKYYFFLRTVAEKRNCELSVKHKWHKRNKFITYLWVALCLKNTQSSWEKEQGRIGVLFTFVLGFFGDGLLCMSERTFSAAPWPCEGKLPGLYVINLFCTFLFWVLFSCQNPLLFLLFHSFWFLLWYKQQGFWSSRETWFFETTLSTARFSV